MEDLESAKKKVPIQNLLSDEDQAMPLIKSGASLMPDMKFGWRPEVKCSHPPIPLYFDFVEHKLDQYNITDEIEGADVIIFDNWRPSDSYQLHKKIANKNL